MMIAKEAAVLFRWDDSSFAATGWGLLLILILIAAIGQIGNHS